MSRTDHRISRAHRAFTALRNQRTRLAALRYAAWFGFAVVTMAACHIGIAEDIQQPQFITSNGEPTTGIVPFNSPPARQPQSRWTTLRRQLFVGDSTPPKVASSDGATPIATTNVDPEGPAAYAANRSDAGMRQAGNQPLQSNRADDLWRQLPTPMNVGPAIVAASSPHVPDEAVPAESAISPLVTAAESMASAEEQKDELATLEKPLTTQQVERISGEPVVNRVAAPSPAEALAEKILADSLLQPFHLINPNPAQLSPARVASGTESNQQARSRKAMAPLSTLENELTMSRSDNLRPRPAPPPMEAPGGGTLVAYQDEPPAPPVTEVDDGEPASADAGRNRDNAPSALAEDELPSDSSVNGMAAASSPTAAEAGSTLEDSLSLQPFHMTNPNPAQLRSPARVASGSDNLRPRPAPPTRSRQIARDQGEAIAMPEMINPFTLTNSPAAPMEASRGAALAAYQEVLPAPPIANVDDGEPASADAGRNRYNAPSALAEDELPSDSSVIGIAGASSPTAAEAGSTLEDSVWLQPFHMSNPNPAQPRSPAKAASGTASNQAARSREGTVQFRALGNQLAMSTSDNLRPRPAPPTGSKQITRNQGWTIAMPEMMNPFTLTNSPAAPREASGGATLAAYQEELPAPPVDDDGEPAAIDPAKDGASEPTALADAEKLGEEPEDTSLQFLRESTVLLKPGESQFDIGVEYLLSESDFPILLLNSGDVVGADDVNFRIRELTVPMQYRFGLLKRVQAFVGGAVGWSNTQVSIDDFEAFQNDGGFGDVDFGATMQLVDGHAEKPHLLATVSATAPTGGEPFGAAAALAPTAPSLGQGFWSISGSTLCIHTYDPLVFYYGVGGEHFFSRRFEGLEIEPGTAWNYSFGVGFAVNDRVTLSTRFRGAYVEELRVNRERVLGTNFEPMSLRMAATISKPEKRLVEPFVEFGLTDGAVSNFFGITWTY